jgi:hypothetical protein
MILLVPNCFPLFEIPVDEPTCSQAMSVRLSGSDNDLTCWSLTRCEKESGPEDDRCKNCIHMLLSFDVRAVSRPRSLDVTVEGVYASIHRHRDHSEVVDESGQGSPAKTQ